jgi:hypothetical protein
MQIITEIIPDEIAELHVIGDIHIGDEAFTARAEKKLKEKIKRIEQNENARLFLNGDILNVSTRISKTTPFSKNTRIKSEEEDYAVELFKPVADKIIGVTDGNHEHRVIDFANYSLLNSFCQRLSTEKRKIVYCGVSCLLFLKVGRPPKHGTPIKWRDLPHRTGQTYSCYIQHTTGGGGTNGGKLNRTDKMRNIVRGCDCYFGNHNHLIGYLEPLALIPNIQRCTLTEVEQHVVDCGAYLDYPEYAERLMCEPARIGSPTTTFFSKEKAVEIINR